MIFPSLILFLGYIPLFVFSVRGQIPSYKTPWIWIPILGHSLILGYWGWTQLWGQSFFALSLLSFVLLASFQILRINHKFEALGGINIPLGMIFLILSVLIPNAQRNANQSWWVFLHVMLILVGFACFAISFGHSVLFLFVRHRLKSKQLKGIGFFPSLEKLDRYNHSATIVGFICLMSGVCSAWLWSLDSGRWKWDSGTIGALVLCAIYAVSIHARIVFGRRMHWTAWFSIGGFALLFVILGLVGYLGGWHMGEA